MQLPPALDREGVRLVDETPPPDGPDGGELPGRLAALGDISGNPPDGLAALI